MGCEAHESVETQANPDSALNTLENNVLQSTIDDMNAQLPCEFLYNVEVDEDWNYTVSINTNHITFHPFVDNFELDFFNEILLELSSKNTEISVEDYFSESEPGNSESRIAVVNFRLGGRMLISNRVDGIFPQSDTRTARQIGNFFTQMVNPI